MNQFKNSTDVLEHYERRRESLTLDVARFSQPLQWLFVLRGILLLAALICLTLFVLFVSWMWGSIGFIFLIGFLGVAFWHESLDRRRRLAKIRLQHDQHSIARMKRDWKRLPVFKTEIPPDRAATVKDLDLFGKASLYQWLCIAKTPMGQGMLRDWILSPARPDVIRHRQQASDILSHHPEYIDQLQVCTQVLTGSRNGPAEFVAWAEDDRWLERAPWLLLSARVLAISFVGSMVGWGLGWLDPTIAGITICIILLINFVITLWFAGRIHDIFNAVAAKQSDVWHYQRLFGVANELPGEGPLLDELRQGLREGRRPAIESIRELGLVAAMANLRRAGLFGLVYLILQFTLLWDLHWLAVLERWHRKHGGHVRNWFETLGHIEAICCLAKLAHDQPQWTVADVEQLPSEKAEIRGEALGHPLLPDDHRVTNDVSVGPPGTFLLVTGSNMSGKSTLLRAIGVNVVLAQLGAVTCTRSFQLPWLEIATSMRVHDSLADGVSFYMAELQRLKGVIDRARQVQQTDGPRLFYLLDEILQGTNSRERHIAVSRVIKHLTETGAIGAVSTHDLELASASELKPRCQCVHFRESFETVDGKDKMVFDYRMRDGVATTTNALKLLSMVGIDDAPPTQPTTSSTALGESEP